MEKMFIEALADLKGGKKKLRELLVQVQEDLEHARDMRGVWNEKVKAAADAVDLIEQKLGREEPKDSIGGE